jgi:hypothetical protein
VTVSADGWVIDEQTLSSLLLGSKEWIDRGDLWPYLPAFVNPQGDGLAELQAAAAEKLAVFGDKDGFDGYDRPPPAQIRQIQALYGALGPRVTRYTTPLGGRIQVPGALEMPVQLVRSPADILTSGTGTCHDLSLLFASFTERVGLYPVIVLMRGHTYFGFWSSRKAWEDQWRPIDQKRRPDDPFGTGWVISSFVDFQRLVADVSVYVVEATAVASPKTAGDFDAAREMAVKRPDESTFQSAIDVARSRVAVQPL